MAGSLEVRGCSLEQTSFWLVTQKQQEEILKTASEVEHLRQQCEGKASP